jgi:glycerophosphoryl diester phosphodiesterase
MERRPPLEIIGHGGAAGFFSSNSEASIRKAIEIAVDRIEVDVISTIGRDLVLVHDETVVLEGVRRQVTSLTTEQLRGFEPDLLLLSDAFEITRHSIPLLLDIKCRGYEVELVTIIRSMRVSEDISVSSTHARTLRRLSAAIPQMRVGLSRGHSLTRIRSGPTRRLAGLLVGSAQIPSLITIGKWCGATEAMANHHICNRALVESLHLAGLRVYSWTVDRTEDAERTIALGVDGIISNRPDMVLKTAARMGVPRL